MIRECNLRNLKPIENYVQESFFGRTKTESRKAILTDESGADVAIVGMEVVKDIEMEPEGTLLVLCTDAVFFKSLFFEYHGVNLFDRIEGVIKVGSFSVSYHLLRPALINKKIYMLFHYTMEREYGTYEEQLNAMAESYHAVATAITDVYKSYLENRCKKKKIELFDKLLAGEPYNIIFDSGSVIHEYKEFFNECQNKYLSTLKKLCPHEYERIILAKKLLNFHSKKN